MSVYIETKYKCSSCGAMSRTETITRDAADGRQVVLRCKGCNHEKVMSTMTTSNGPGGVIEMPEHKEIELF